jgi:hypothetical protein
MMFASLSFAATHQWMANSSTLVLMPMMTMASCRVVLRGEGVEREHNANVARWILKSGLCTICTTNEVRACLFAFTVLKQRVNKAKKAE